MHVLHSFTVRPLPLPTHSIPLIQPTYSPPSTLHRRTRPQTLPLHTWHRRRALTRIIRIRRLGAVHRTSIRKWARSKDEEETSRRWWFEEEGSESDGWGFGRVGDDAERDEGCRDVVNVCMLHILTFHFLLSHRPPYFITFRQLYTTLHTLTSMHSYTPLPLQMHKYRRFTYQIPTRRPPKPLFRFPNKICPIEAEIRAETHQWHNIMSPHAHWQNTTKTLQW